MKMNQLRYNVMKLALSILTFFSGFVFADTAFVVDNNRKEVYVVDMATNAVTATVNNPSGFSSPEYIALSPSS